MDELEQREMELSEMQNRIAKESKPVAAIRLDILRQMIDEIENNPVLDDIFDGDVSTNLAIVSKEDFGIFETKNIEMSDSNKIALLKELGKIFERYKEEYSIEGGEDAQGSQEGR